MKYLTPREHLDSAILFEKNGRVIYDFNELIYGHMELFRESNPEMSDAELLDLASDWVDFNLIGALSYMNDHGGPVIVVHVPSDLLEDFFDVEEEMIEHNGQYWRVLS